MSTNFCAVCGQLYEGSEDHPRDPCAKCFKNGWRIDSCGNKHNSLIEQGISFYQRLISELVPEESRR